MSASAPPPDPPAAAGSADRAGHPRALSAAERDDFAAARLLAVTWMPYLATALFELTPLASRGLGSVAVDPAWRLYLDPDLLARWNPEQTAGVLLHEASHLLRDHHTRRGERPDADPTAWNVAADAEINDDLAAAHIPLPDTPITPGLLDQPDGQLAETYLAALHPAPAVEDPACGSGAGATPLAVELPADAEPAGHSAIDAALIRRRVAEAITAAASGPQPGGVPGGWRRWAEATISPPQISWRQRLRRTVRRGIAVHAGQLDPTYQRPGRRRIPRVITPAMTQPAVTIAVIVDTSASMHHRQLHTALSELDAIRRHAGIRADQLLTVTADTRVHETRRLRRAADLPLLGGGGTDLRGAIAHLARHRHRPHLLVVLTDGFTPWPDQPPAGCTTIAVMLSRTDGHTPDPPPDWVEPITLTA